MAHGFRCRQKTVFGRPVFLAALAMASLFATSAGFAQTDEVDLDGTTPHGSFIENGMDPALIGTWTILQVQIEQGGGAIVFPNSGATLSILDSGSFKEDYSSESNGPRSTNIVAGDYITTTRQSPVSTCKMVETGKVIGSVSAYWEEETGTMDAPELRVQIFPSASTRARVRCAGSSQLLGNMATPALGMGRPSGTDSEGPYVTYKYMLDRDIFTSTPNDFTDLEIWSVSNNPVRTRYFLRLVE